MSFFPLPRIQTIARAFIGLDESNINTDPFKQFELWLQDAMKARLTHPDAMTLSTVSPDGKPSARIVLLRGCDENGFVFYTNYKSRKGMEISKSPWAILTFFWEKLERQIRIEGRINKVSDEQSDTYFKSRPRSSQIGAWASPQSKTLANRALLVEEFKQFKKKFKGFPVPRPPHWGGYCLKPDKIEFWQARADRLHDRILYILKDDGSWKIERLAP